MNTRTKAALLALAFLAAAPLAHAGMGEDLADLCRTVHPLNERMEALLRYGNATAETYYMRRLVNDGERDYTELDAANAAAKAASERLDGLDHALFARVTADRSFASAMKFESYGPATLIQRPTLAGVGLVEGQDFTITEGECYGRLPAANEPL